MRSLTARLVVAADGRSSSARVWGKFNARRGSQKLFGAGALLENFPGADDTGLFLTNSDVGHAAFIFPQGNGRARAYFFYGGDDLNRLQGEQDKPASWKRASNAACQPRYTRERAFWGRLPVSI
jgi:2-polyprenyl-6-methoxyphenol hydroxylase-like FAD-dependent oxidoreductase